MSLLFSKVTITPKVGPMVTINESGHPDEYDLRQLLMYEKRYAPVRKPEYYNASISVRQYRFQVKGRDWLAERDSFALMAAYDKLALRHGEKPFVQRGDVELVEQFTIFLNLCDLCAHRGLLTMADVGSCNCCDKGELSPDIHAKPGGNMIYGRNAEHLFELREGIERACQFLHIDRDRLISLHRCLRKWRAKHYGSYFPAYPHREKIRNFLGGFTANWEKLALFCHRERSAKKCNDLDCAYCPINDAYMVFYDNTQGK